MYMNDIDQFSEIYEICNQ